MGAFLGRKVSSHRTSMTSIDRPADAGALLSAVRAFVSDEVLPNVVTWDRDDVLPDSAFDRLRRLA